MVELSLEVPKTYFEDEVRCDYLVERQMKEVWAVELDLLHKLLEVCEKHNIKIFAEGGTLLGAIRHRGMIPWDDDIDMMIFREDYNRLCEVAQEEFKAPYFFQTEYSDPGTIRGHAQLRNSETTAILKCEEGNAKFNQGIYIDIFPLDAVVADEQLLRKQHRDALKWKNLAWKFSAFSYRYQADEEFGLKKIIKHIVHPFANVLIRTFKLEEWAYKKFEKICQRYNHLATERVSTLSYDFGNEKLFLNRSDLSAVVWVPFEFMDIPVCVGYENVLQKVFGNYHEFVKGTSMHGKILFDVERGYMEHITQ